MNVKSKEGSNIGKEFGQSPVVVIVEGFLLFTDKNLTAFLDYCLFLDLKCETGNQTMTNQIRPKIDFVTLPHVLTATPTLIPFHANIPLVIRNSLPAPFLP